MRVVGLVLLISQRCHSCDHPQIGFLIAQYRDCEGTITQNKIRLAYVIAIRSQTRGGVVYRRFRQSIQPKHQNL